MFSINDPDSNLMDNIRSHEIKIKKLAEDDLFRKYYYWIKEATFKHKISEDDAFTAYSKACHSAIIHIENATFKGDSLLKTFFYKIFERRILDILRSNTTKPETIDIADVFSTDVQGILSNIENKIDNIRLNELLATLGEPCFSVLKMWSEGYSHAEIKEFVSKMFKFHSRIDDKITSCMNSLRNKFLGK